MIYIIRMNMRKMLRNIINNLIIAGVSIFFLSGCAPKTQIKKATRVVSIDTLFYSNGKINEIYATIDSVKQGLCIGYDTLGRKIYESTYVDGEWYGPYIAYNSRSNNIMTKAFYKKGVWDGEFVSYYESGNISYTKIFVNGEANGISCVYTEDGELAQKLMYKNGDIVEVIFNNHKLTLPLPSPEFSH